MKAEFPDAYLIYRQRGLPGGHPLMVRRAAFWKAHEVPCITWSYDDSDGSICREHWQQVAAMLKDEKDE